MLNIQQKNDNLQNKPKHLKIDYFYVLSFVKNIYIFSNRQCNFEMLENVYAKKSGNMHKEVQSDYWIKIVERFIFFIVY